MTRQEAINHIVQELSDYRLTWESELLLRGIPAEQVARELERENLLDFEALSTVFDSEELRLAVESAV